MMPEIFYDDLVALHDKLSNPRWMHQLGEQEVFVFDTCQVRGWLLSLEYVLETEKNLKEKKNDCIGGTEKNS